jgi:ATP-dependent exoDNAse (exonuclease V) beta subunit
VLLFTDLSHAQHVSRMKGGHDADDILRMLYVGATRAKESLTVVSQYGG